MNTQTPEQRILAILTDVENRIGTLADLIDSIRTPETT